MQILVFNIIFPQNPLPFPRNQFTFSLCNFIFQVANISLDNNNFKLLTSCVRLCTTIDIYFCAIVFQTSNSNDPFVSLYSIRFVCIESFIKPLLQIIKTMNANKNLQNIAKFVIINGQGEDCYELVLMRKRSKKLNLKHSS